MSWIGNIIKAIFNNEGLHKEPIEVKEEKPKVDLRVMTKKQLEEYGRTLGFELDRRHSKKSLIETIEKFESNQK